MKDSGSINSQVTYEIFSVIIGESEEEEPGGRLLAVSQENWTLA